MYGVFWDNAQWQPNVLNVLRVTVNASFSRTAAATSDKNFHKSYLSTQVEREKRKLGEFLREKQTTAKPNEGKVLKSNSDGSPFVTLLSRKGGEPRHTFLPLPTLTCMALPYRGHGNCEDLRHFVTTLTVLVFGIARKKKSCLEEGERDRENLWSNRKWNSCEQK